MLGKEEREAIQSNQRATKTLLEALTLLRRALEPAGDDGALQMVRSAQYVALLRSDMNVLYEATFTERDPDKASVFARFLAVTLVEGVDDLTTLLGKPFREYLLSDADLEPYLNPLSEVHSAITALGRQHSGALRALRNSTAAHREHDAQTQLEAMNKLDPNSLNRLCVEFIGCTTRLADLYTSVIKILALRTRTA